MILIVFFTYFAIPSKVSQKIFYGFMNETISFISRNPDLSPGVILLQLECYDKSHSDNSEKKSKFQEFRLFTILIRLSTKAYIQITRKSY